jgi:YggT family protein
MSFLISIVDLIFGLYSLMIIARVFMDLMRVDPYHPLMQFLYRATEPLLSLLRARIPPIGMVDISPMAALFILWILEKLLVMLLIGLA